MRTMTMRSTAPRTITVNDAIIASADIAREVQNHAGTTPKQAWDEATRALVIRELLLQRARGPATSSRNRFRRMDCARPRMKR